MAALLDQSTTTQHQNAISRFHRGQAVGITTAVRRSSSRSRSRCRVASVEGSMKAVASSITSTLGLRIVTLATARS